MMKKEKKRFLGSGLRLSPAAMQKKYSGMYSKDDRKIVCASKKEAGLCPAKGTASNIYYKIAFHGEYLKKKNERVGNDPDIFCPDIFCPSYFVRAR